MLLQIPPLDGGEEEEEEDDDEFQSFSKAKLHELVLSEVMLSFVDNDELSDDKPVD